MIEAKRTIAVVTHDGKKTYASLLDRGAMSKGSAYCRKNDEFKPEIGAVIALCKAYGRDPGEVCYDVLSAMASAGKNEEPSKLPDAATRVSKRGIPAGRIRSGELVLMLGEDYAGKPGTPTAFKDVDGKSLFVGDLVTISALVGDVRTGRKWKDIGSLAFVADEPGYKYGKGPYIHGMILACNPKTGKIDGRFKVRLAKRWQEVEVGEEHGAVRLVWEGDHE